MPVTELHESLLPLEHDILAPPPLPKDFDSH